MDGGGRIARRISGASAVGVRLPERGIGRMLREGHRAFNYALADRLAPHGITLGQWLHLRTLWEDDGLTQVELAGRIGIEKASSTPVLDSLEAQRLIRRVRNKGDRRKSNVFLTPAGKALKASLVPHAVAVNALARRRLSARELAAFIKVLEIMVDNLRRIPEPERRALARGG